MIRAAARQDLPRLCDIAQAFFAEGAHRGPRRAFSWVHFGGYLERVIAAPGGGIFVLEKRGAVAGFIVGMLAPSPYSGELTCVKLQWCVDPDTGRGHGLLLLRHLTKWARDAGAVEILAASMTHEGAEILAHLGFAAFETNLYKALK